MYVIYLHYVFEVNGINITNKKAGTYKVLTLCQAQFEVFDNSSNPCNNFIKQLHFTDENAEALKVWLFEITQLEGGRAKI